MRPKGSDFHDLAHWANEHDGQTIFKLANVAAFGVAAKARSVETWSDDCSAGAFLGEIYETHQQERGAHNQLNWPAPSRRLAQLFEDARETGLKDIEGLFCAAIWDKQAERLVLYRDPSCSQTLYWLRIHDSLIAATRLSILVNLPGVTKGIGRRGLLEYLRFLDVSPPHTIYAGGRSAEPGEPLVFEQHGRLGPIASPQTQPGNEDALTTKHTQKTGRITVPFDSAVDSLDEALRNSVEKRLDSTGTMGISLSGGIDSSLLCAIAAQIAPSRVAAFTLGFSDHDYDESPTASAIAKALDVPHYLSTFDLDDYARRFPDFLSQIDFPFADPAGLPTWLFFQACRKHCGVLLDGTGADTLVGVMPARHTRIAIQYAARLPRPVRHAIGRVLGHIPLTSQYSAIWDFDSPEDLLIRWKGWSRQEIEQLVGSTVSLEHTRFYRLFSAFSKDAHFERYSALLGNLPDDRVHEAAALTGMRVRFPFWDHRVETVINDLPQHYRFTEQQPKRLLRALLARYLPTSVWDQPKHGFDFPFVALMKHDDFDLVRRFVAPEVVHDFDIVSPEVVMRSVDAFLAGDDDFAFRIWALVVLFGWLQRHYATT